MKASFLTAVALLGLVTFGDLLVAQQGRQSESTPAPKTTASQARAQANLTAAFQSEFKTRIDDYMKIRKEAAKGAPSFNETSDPAKIKVAEQALAVRMQTLRATAQPGDIFTPTILNTFKQLLAPELKGEDGKDTKDILKDDAPKAVPLKVNAKYPEKAPLPTVPSNLLLSLPSLPKELEYRIVGKNLILRDTGTDLIVDFISNAIK